MSKDQVAAAVTHWLSIDRNTQTRAELEALAAGSDHEALASVLLNRMAFGTAGLRARMGAGYACMNDVTVIQSSQGLAQYLLSEQGDVVKEKGVVIGFDARHNSQRFAQLAAVAMLRLGIPVHLFSAITPTPFVAYACLHYRTSAGIMVTASHNPKEDNGYKVYWSNGAQIIPPHDTGIADKILANLTIEEAAWDTAMLSGHKLCTDPYKEIWDAYYTSLTKNIMDKERNGSGPLKITYTPMHGVGQRFMKRSFEVFGLPEFISVPQQCEPDPEFSTVAYPNPEEGKSALDLAMAAANAAGSRVILANDPDADRLAAAERQEDGSWRVFNGNELGAMFGAIALSNYRDANPGSSSEKLYMNCSTVSSKFLRSMAAAEGFLYEECLTGFKWMANMALLKQAEGYTCLLGFEESIGYMYGMNVLDKDGISAGPILAAKASQLYQDGSTLSAFLESLYVKYGRHISDNSYYLCFEPAKFDLMFGEIRKGGGYPEKVGKFRVAGVRDLTVGFDSSYADKKPRLPVCPGSHMITFTFENGCIATLRTSGTEPKIKYYTEIVRGPGSPESEEELRAELSEVVGAIVKELLQPEKFGLKPRPS